MNLRHTRVAAVASACMLIGGCASHPHSHHSESRSREAHPHAHHGGLGPLHDADDRPRSLVLDAPGVTSLNTLQPWLGEQQAWYDYRNDDGPRVVAGYRSAIYEQSVTYTRDGQSISGNHIRDNYHQRTYRTTVRESVR